MDSEVPNEAWYLLWSDEFNGPDGSYFDSSKWSGVIGGDGWGNMELQYYSDEVSNIQQRGGNLVITATRETTPRYDCWYGPCEYASARLQTKLKFEQTYGRFEARIKIPRGQGIWPAFWMLGADIDTVGWPTCGEIDIMENVGREPNIVHATLHGPGYSGAGGLSASYRLDDRGAFSDDFHTFAMEWNTESIRFYVDEIFFESRTVADIPSASTWVFDHAFFILLNIAVGGNLPGNPDTTTMFPQVMFVDYVRVYQFNG